MSITLGHYDYILQPADLEAFKTEIRQLSEDRSETLGGEQGDVSLRATRPGFPLTVAELQRALIAAGFLPGGKVDGICGYRTFAAIRLYQEYVRAYETPAIVPDGIAGKRTVQELQRWINDRAQASWAPKLSLWKSGALSRTACEYNDWLALLEKVKLAHLAKPGILQRLVGEYSGKTDTRAVSNWEFSSNDIHILGIRHSEHKKADNFFDDAIVLLIKGMVFKFQGSTDPGKSSHEEGAPFLVYGQHDYCIGLHGKKYYALRPRHYREYGKHGVLVVRSKGDYKLTAEDIESGLEANTTINIHWGGAGVKAGAHKAVGGWSAGCQVITGSGYQNFNGDMIDCTGYEAASTSALSSRKTRGAYNVLADLVIALSSDMKSPGHINYMLIDEADLDVLPGVKLRVAESRAAASRLINSIA